MKYSESYVTGLVDERNYLQNEVRELRTTLDETRKSEREARRLVFEKILKPQLELEELISSYNDGLFDDARTDRRNTLASYPEKYDDLREKYKDKT